MISTQDIISQDSGKEYQLYIYQGVARGCTCAYRKHQHNKACKHMRLYNCQVVIVSAEQQRKDAERTAYNNFCLSMGI
jgi:hypothetical protein